ncbi:hypothetical protein RUM43_003119 [Polyplax serrata]|uniref:FLYWCH-type domain-containing protein n=1 Tax=Polyplax serrata TaxID=468196 RepID=A0AAN8S5D4_POLSC
MVPFCFSDSPIMQLFEIQKKSHIEHIPITQYQVVTSQKGRPKIYHEGYNYIRNNRPTCKKAYWACSQYWTQIKCNVKAVLQEDERNSNHRMFSDET